MRFGTKVTAPALVQAMARPRYVGLAEALPTVLHPQLSACWEHTSRRSIVQWGGEHPIRVSIKAPRWHPVPVNKFAAR